MCSSDLNLFHLEQRQTTLTTYQSGFTARQSDGNQLGSPNPILSLPTHTCLNANGEMVQHTILC